MTETLEGVKNSKLESETASGRNPPVSPHAYLSAEETIPEKFEVVSSPEVDADPPLELKSAEKETDDAKTPLATTEVTADPLLTMLKVIRRHLAILSTLSILALLYLAQAVFIPLALSIVLSLLLRPAVRWMYRRRIPETFGAIISMSAVVIVILAGIIPLLGPARDWLDHLPEHLERANEKLHVFREQLGQWGKVRTQIAELASGNDQEQAPVAVTVKEPELTSNAGVLSATGNMVGMWLVVLVLTFFLLIEGDSLLNSLLTILPTFREKRRTVELIKEIENGVSSYLVTITMINTGLGLVIGVALWIMGVPNPAVWGLLTAVFNYVPFVGQGVAGLIIGFVALLTFDSLSYALLVPVVFYLIAAIEGNIVTPALVGRKMSLNPILVMCFLVWWGWMWGIVGAALAVPILAMVKITCEHFDITTPAVK